MRRWEILDKYNLSVSYFNHLIEDGVIVKIHQKKYIIDEEYFKSFNSTEYKEEFKQRPESIAKRRAARQKQLSDPDYRKRVRLSLRRTYANKELRDKISTSVKKHNQTLTEEQKQLLFLKRSEAQKRRWATMSEEQYKIECNARSQQTLKYWSSLSNEDKQKRIDKCIEVQNRPEQKQKQSERMKSWHRNLSIEEKQRISSKLKQKQEEKHRTGYYLSKEWLEIDKKRQQKIAETKKKNKTYNTSKSAEDFKLWLRQKDFTLEEEKPYPNAPNLHCDIYIQKLNLWVELHFSYLHNTKPFDKSNPEHIKELEDLITLFNSKPKLHRNTNMYGRLIYNWTDLDVRKRQCAKDNNLNFLELFSPNEAYEYFETLVQPESNFTR